MNYTNSEVLKPSWKRVLGSAFLGFWIGGTVWNAFEQARNRMFEGSNFSLENLLNIDTAVGIIMWICIVFLGAFLAGIFARKKGLLVGPLANSIYIIAY